VKIKFNWLQARKYKLIRKFLKSDAEKKHGLLLSYCDDTKIYSLMMLYNNGSGLYIKGKAYPEGKYTVDRLYDGTEITAIYKAGVKGDNDFRDFIDQEKK